MSQNVATKELKRQARGLIEGLESRVHRGPPVRDAEILSALEFLRQNGFSPASDYFNRLGEIQVRVAARGKEPVQRVPKGNYGGAADGRWVQVQSAYDHLILSTCYDGAFNLQRGRIKISHRFNQEGRIDFVELKFLQSLEPCLTGKFRKLVLVEGFQSHRKDWQVAQAFVLPLLPRELIFLHADIFRFPRSEVLSWLVNLGHRLSGELVEYLRMGIPDRCAHRAGRNGDQLPLEAMQTDEVAAPILKEAAGLECLVYLQDERLARISYSSLALRH